MADLRLEGLPSFLESAEKIKLGQQFNYLITTIGFSPEPAILFITALQKYDNLKRVLFIVTPETENKMNIIIEHTKLKPSIYERIKVKRTTGVSDIFNKIKSFVSDYNINKVLIDATAGTKPMTAAAVMAGSILGIDVAYADYKKYDEEKRRPDPSTQYVTFLENPILNDIKLLQAKKLFNTGRFYQANSILSDLRDKSFITGDLRVAENICIAYALWDEFKINEAITNYQKAIKDKCIDKTDLPISEIITNFDTLKKFYRSKEYKSLPILFFSSAERNYKLERFDIAVLLYYRTLEALATQILKEIGINKDKVNWSNIDNQIIKKYENLLKGMFKSSKTIRRENKLALFSQCTLISAHNNTIFNKEALRNIKQKTELRNKSYLTHGEITLEQTHADDLKTLVKPFLEEWFTTKNMNLDTELKNLTFPTWK